MKKLLCLVVAVAMASPSATFAASAVKPASAPVGAEVAAAPLLIAADSSSGTYAQMLKEISAVCSAPDHEIQLTKNTGGAVGNLEALVNNKAIGAFMHSDVFLAARMADSNYSNYKTLVALYPEDIHILALRNSRAKMGGIYGINAKVKNFNNLADLDGFLVGAAGGGVKTMQILLGNGGARFNPKPYDKGGDLIPALDRGEIQAAIFVGGAPLPNLVNLNADQYKLISISESIASRLAGVYRPTKITYTNLHASQVSTMAPVATLMTRAYKTPRFVQAQVKFRSCFYDHLDEMRETPGYHTKWQVVKAWDHGVLDWLDLPGDQAGH